MTIVKLIIWYFLGTEVTTLGSGNSTRRIVVSLTSHQKLQQKAGSVTTFALQYGYLITKTACNDATVANGNIEHHIDSHDMTSLFNIAVTFILKVKNIQNVTITK